MKLRTISMTKKINLLFIVISILPLLVAIFITYQEAKSSIEEMSQKQLDYTISILNNNFDQKAENALAIAKRLARESEFISAFEKKDRTLLKEKTLDSFRKLYEDDLVSVFEFGDEKGIVFFRAHNPTVYGDNKIENQSIASALKGETVKGFEFGKSGLAIRAFVPILSGNKVIGTFQIGYNFNLNNKLITLIHNLISSSIALYNQDVLFATSDTNELQKLGQKIKDGMIYENVCKGLGAQIPNQDGNYSVYYPLRDPTAKKVYGMIRVTPDLSYARNLKDKTQKISSILCLVILLVIIFVSYFISNVLTKKMNIAIKAVKRVSQGNLDTRLDDQLFDSGEMGLLLQSLDAMTNNLKVSILDRENLLEE